MVGFVKSYFPVFLLGAVFGKVIELSGFSKSIVAAVIGLVGRERAMLSIVLVGALLTYGGVSLFVVVFAVYPFAAEMFRQGGIPKRLIPGTIALGAFTFTMDSLPGTPQIQNIIPTTFFKTDTWAAPILGTIGALFILAGGMAYLEWRRRQAAAAGEGYGEGHTNEPEPVADEQLAHPAIAILPLVIVGLMNIVLTVLIARYYGATYEVTLAGMTKPLVTQVSSVAAIWAVEGALFDGHPYRSGFCLRTSEEAVCRRDEGCGRWLSSSVDEHRVRIRLRRCDRRTARLSCHRRRAEGHSQSTCERSDHSVSACRHHGLGLGRHEHRFGCHGRPVHLSRKRGRHSPRSSAPRRVDGERGHGHTTP